MVEQIERQIIQLVAADRLYIPVSSLAGKLERRRPKLADAINLAEHEGDFQGERVFAKLVVEDGMKARKMSDAIELFSETYPQHGKILAGMIAEKRLKKEPHLYFGVNAGCRLTSDDYLAVMKDLGFGEVSANSLYHELIEVSRNLSRKRDEDRSILVG